MGDNGDKIQEIKKMSLIIEYGTDGRIEVKGEIKDNEMLAIWLLEKVKDLIKVHTMQKLMKAQSKIIKPHGIMNFIRNKK